MDYSLRLVTVCLTVLISACGGESETTMTTNARQTDLRALLNVPEHFSLPAIPEYNIPTQEKIVLGRRLFYDTKLSANETQSCASCHHQSLAFSDGVTTPFGSTGHQLVRNSQGLANTAYHPTFTWANEALLELEDQLQIPIRADNPIELGVTPNEVDTVLERFNRDSTYVSLFANAFPDSSTGATINKVIHALASFCRTMISGDSPYDRFYLGDTSALTEQQILGMQLFNSEKFECFHCHSGINFSTSYRDNNSNLGTQTYPFFNNGLYNVDGEGSYPDKDQGLYDATFNPSHRGLFRPPSLRNIALTAPYMHDGSIASLREVIEHYANGGRLIETGTYAGDGRTSPLKSGLIRSFSATDDEIDAVVAFLESLTDETFINNPDLANPFLE